MSRNKKKPRYLSYLLRLWETDDGGRRVWRASLEFPANGERRGFASLADLFLYLEHETDPENNQPTAAGHEPDPKGLTPH